MNSGDQAPKQPIRLAPRFGLGILVLFLASFVGTTFSTFAACILFWLLALFSVIVGDIVRRRRLATRVDARGRSSARVAKNTSDGSLWRTIWQTSAMLALLVASLLFAFTWRVSDRISEVASFLVLTVDMISHYCVIVLCLFWAVWPRRGHVSMLALGMLVVMGCVAGGGVSRSLPAQTAVGLASVMGFVVAAQIILSQSRRSASGSTTAASATAVGERPTGLRREMWPYSLLTLSIILIAASAVTQLTGMVLPDVQAGVFAQLKDRFEHTESGLPASTSGYVSGRRLGSVQQTMLSDPNGITLRAYCDRAPGYLRGNVFDNYNRRSWRTLRRWVQKNSEGVVVDNYRAKIATRLGDANVPLKETPSRSRSRFSLRLAEESSALETSALEILPLEILPLDGDLSGPFDASEFSETSASNAIRASGGAENAFAAVVEIHGEPEKGVLVFLPAAAAWIECRSDAIGVTPHGLVDRGIGPSEPWVAGVMLSSEREFLPPESRALMSWVEPQMSDSIAPLAEEICGDVESASGKAERIAAFFQNNFEYTLQTEAAPSSIDPIVYFLRKRHPAHCELFASASTLMLRCQGVPARYVTGYVMDELDPKQKRYLARNRDAHAWVEYYDDRSQRWRPLESTPGRVYQTLDQANRPASFNQDENRDFGRDFAALGWLRSAWGDLRSLRITDLLSLVFRLLQLPLLVGLVGWLWWRRRRTGGDAAAIALANARRAMDRRLRGRGCVRRGSETLHQFATRIESLAAKISDNPSDPKQRKRLAELNDAAQWYRQHAVELFRCSW